MAVIDWKTKGLQVSNFIYRGVIDTSVGGVMGFRQHKRDRDATRPVTIRHICRRCGLHRFVTPHEENESVNIPFKKHVCYYCTKQEVENAKAVQ